MSAHPHEAPRDGGGEAFSDALTVSFGDAAADVFGVTRLGLADGGASGLVILFAGGAPVAVAAEGGLQPDGVPASWDDVQAAGLSMQTVEAGRAWRVRFAGDDARIDLELDASGAIAELDEDEKVARLGGMTGFDQPVRVRGGVTTADGAYELDGRGQRGRSWGAPDWGRIALARTVSAWFDDDRSVSLTAIRPAKKSDHEAEAVAATWLDAAGDGGNGGGPIALPIADARLSTTYDAEGRQRAAGLELWIDEDGWAHRAAGEVVCGTSLDLGRLHLDCAFLRWRMEGREGFGRYDILRRA
ncbi:MAG: hypothetical protein M3P44_07720 [Actinomycetota bacterium]|nr:hypothetical protein [Actinomycetota bacterium]